MAELKSCPFCGRKPRAVDIIESVLAKDEPTISKMEQVEPQTCSFSDCDNFKNPDYARCIECKRKQIMLKDEPQTERLCNNCKYYGGGEVCDHPIIGEVEMGGKGDTFPWIKETPKWCPLTDEPQTIRCPKCGRTDYIRDMEKDMGIKGSCYKYKCINCNTYIKDEPQTERSK